MSTNSVSAKSIQRSWHLVDAKNQTLGRLAGNVAKTLMGKNKVNYVPYLDMGDFVVITNASMIKVTGRKAEQKNYYNHSGYPGGLRTRSFTTVLATNPQEILKRAIKGMLPNNKLRSKMLKKLFVFPNTDHPYKKQLKQETPEVKAETAEVKEEVVAEAPVETKEENNG